MSNRAERFAEDEYERENDFSAPVSGEYEDDSYAHETGTQGFSKGIPVQSDDADYDDPMQPPFSNSNQQLGTSVPICPHPVLVGKPRLTGMIM